MAKRSSNKFVVILIQSLLFFLLNNPLRCEAGSVLYSGGTLYPGQFLESENLQLILQKDCNLVLFRNGTKYWATNTEGTICYVTLENTGDMVVYNALGQPMWDLGLESVGNYILVLGQGHMSEYGPSRWASNTTVDEPILYPTDLDMRAENVLFPGQILYPGNSLKNGKWELKMEYDCNLVLYEEGNNEIWSTKTSKGKGAVCYLEMETTGDLVIYDGSKQQIWASNTGGVGLSVLVLRNNRDLVIYGPLIMQAGTGVL